MLLKLLLPLNLKLYIKDTNCRNKRDWDTVKEYADSTLADDADNAAKLREAYATAL